VTILGKLSQDGDIRAKIRVQYCKIIVVGQLCRLLLGDKSSLHRMFQPSAKFGPRRLGEKCPFFYGTKYSFPIP